VEKGMNPYALSLDEEEKVCEILECGKDVEKSGFFRHN